MALSSPTALSAQWACPRRHSLQGALSEKDESLREVQTVVNRFAPQTGQVADVDKHTRVHPLIIGEQATCRSYRD